MARRDQDRAKFALGKIDDVKKLDPGQRTKFKTQLLKLPARLHTNGLGPTVAFYLSAGPGKPEVEICAWLQQWLSKPEVGIYSSGRLIKSIADGPESTYRLASEEVRALAVWLKRFAEAFLDEGKP